MFKQNVPKIYSSIENIRFNLIMDLVEGGIPLRESISTIGRLTNNQVIELKIELFEVIE